MRLTHNPLDFNGRLGRQNFWLTAIAIGLIAVAFQVVASLLTVAVLTAAPQQYGLTAFALFIGARLILWMILAARAKRRRDRGKSAL